MSIPVTPTRTDHSLSIKVSGITIGRIQDWSPTQNRNVVSAYEINGASDGGIAEVIPGNMTNLTIAVTRFDLYASKMEEVWGPDFNIYMLNDQRNPLTIKEKWTNPDGSEESWLYTGCWFTSLGRSHSAQGDRITRVTASLAYTRKYKASELAAVGERVIEKLFSGL